MEARVLTVGERSYKYGKIEKQNQPHLQNSAVQNQSSEAVKKTFR